MTKLGYTWYPKDWRSSMNVSQLSLQEKGFYRELIDECYLQNSNKIAFKMQTFTRLHGINSRSFEKLLQNLHETLLILIEKFDKNTGEVEIVINSVSDRLGMIKKASKGGSISSREGVKNEPKKVTKEKLKEKEKLNIPDYDTFLNYAIEKEPKINRGNLKMKYDSWVESGWVNGLGRPIKNWKSTLLNTIPHLGLSTREDDKYQIKPQFD